jgi:aldose 1-epimerase
LGRTDNITGSPIFGIDHCNFGRTQSGLAIDLYTLRNGAGLDASIMTYGGTLVSLSAPDRDGRAVDVVLGFDDLPPYLGSHPYFGCIVGRYANRIAGGTFSLGGVNYSLAQNDGPNHLHGGILGFDRVVWNARPRITDSAAELELTYLSPDDEEGYPGNLNVKVVYALTAANELCLRYSAATDKTTIVNLTNHAYFNLRGSGTVLRHALELPAERFLPVDQKLIPTGEMRLVKGTAFDFTKSAAIGAQIYDDNPQIKISGGYDHCWVLENHASGCRLAARLSDPESGRVLTVSTTQPGVQLYTANFMDSNMRGKRGLVYEKHAGICLETQHFPDSPHHSEFPSTVLRPGEQYRETTIYRFDVAG